MNRHDLLDSFYLNNDELIDNDIHPEARIDTNIAVLHRQSDLPFDSQTAYLQLMGKALFIDRFEKTRPESGMD